MISAWAAGQRLVLGQRAVGAKDNEITAIPERLALLSLKGAILTIDAIFCQKKIATAIRERGADYLLALKENQPALYRDPSIAMSPIASANSAPAASRIAPRAAPPLIRPPMPIMAASRSAATGLPAILPGYARGTRNGPI